MSFAGSIPLTVVNHFSPQWGSSTSQTGVLSDGPGRLVKMEGTFPAPQRLDSQRPGVWDPHVCSLRYHFRFSGLVSVLVSVCFLSLILMTEAARAMVKWA